MAEVYPQDTYQPEISTPPPRRGLSGWMIALIVVGVIILLCCLCAVLFFVVGPALLGPQVGNVFSQIIETVEATTPMP